MEKKHATIYRCWYFAIYVSNPSCLSLNDLNIRLSPIYDTLIDWAFCRIRSVNFCVASAFILQLSNLYFHKYVTINQSIAPKKEGYNLLIDTMRTAVQNILKATGYLNEV